MPAVNIDIESLGIHQFDGVFVGYKCCSAFLFLGINFSPVHMLFAFKISFHVSVALAIAGKRLCLISAVNCDLLEFLSVM